ncbi:MAG: translation initiation factor [Verrucomicrobiota bacterium]
MGKKKKKIDVGEDSLTGSLNNAFSGLMLEGLPEGPEKVASVAEVGQPAAMTHSKRGELILRRETARRAGKAVIIVEGLPALESEASITDLAAGLKKHCGCGGTIKNGEIVIQGEKASEVADFLGSQGFRVRGITR